MGLIREPKDIDLVFDDREFTEEELRLLRSIMSKQGSKAQKLSSALVRRLSVRELQGSISRSKRTRQVASSSRKQANKA